MTINREQVVGLVDSMRRDAEASIASVQATADTADGKGAIERIVGGFYNVLDTTGQRIVRAHMALAAAMGRNPSQATRDAFQASIGLLTYWTALGEGFSTYVRPASPSERGQAVQVGIAPAVVIVAVAGAAAVTVIAVSITGCAWAVVHYAQAANLRHELEILEANPATADALAKLNEGGGAGGGPGLSTGTVIGIGAALAALVGGGIWLANRKAG